MYPIDNQLFALTVDIFETGSRLPGHRDGHLHPGGHRLDDDDGDTSFCSTLIPFIINNMR